MKFFLIVMLYSSQFASGPYDTREACEEARAWVIERANARGHLGTEKYSRCVAS